MQKVKQEVEITGINVSDTKKDGSKLITKNGKPFWKVGITTDKYNERWANGLVFEPVSWKKGDTVTLVFYEEEYNGVTSLKFEMPRRDDDVREALKRIEEKVNFLVSKYEDNSIHN